MFAEGSVVEGGQQGFRQVGQEIRGDRMFTVFFYKFNNYFLGREALTANINIKLGEAFLCAS